MALQYHSSHPLALCNCDNFVWFLAMQCAFLRRILWMTCMNSTNCAGMAFIEKALTGSTVDVVLYLIFWSKAVPIDKLGNLSTNGYAFVDEKQRYND